ncbi:MAG: large subunit ribosomal protein [Thermoleophilaceae bacterium]|jgi:large subunit ribosomal protein L25|nr:large subunit ribosomal protein [Thermoleophilaceae bacterium]
MAQDRPTLNVEPRTADGSRSTRRLRRSGFVPGVIYGEGQGCQSFKANERELSRLLSSGAAVFDIALDGDPIPVIVKDQQLHPVRGQVMHIDMLRVNLKESIQTTVLVELHGSEDAPGVSEGGVLEQVTRELTIAALPGDIPEKIDVDVSGLEAAATLHLSELTPPEGVTFIDDPDETIIATITIPTEVPETEIEEETELVAEGEAAASDEDAAAAEGATGDEAEASAGQESSDS